MLRAIGRREGLGATVEQRKAKSQFRVVVGLLFSFERQNAALGREAAFLPFKDKKKHHDHPKL